MIGRIVILIALTGCAREAPNVRAPRYVPLYSEVTGTWVMPKHCDGIPLVDAQNRVGGCFR